MSEVEYLEHLEMSVHRTPDGVTGPVVVLVHGAGLDRQDYASFATTLAREGALVFNTDWTVLGPSVAVGTEQIACAVRFAGAHAVDYGGLGAAVVLVAHSAAGLPALIAAVGAAPDSGLCPADRPHPAALVLLAAAQSPGTPPWPLSLLGDDTDLEIAVVHGVDDRVIDPARSRRTVELLRDAGYDVTYHLLPGGHYDLAEVTPVSRPGAGAPDPRAVDATVSIILGLGER